MFNEEAIIKRGLHSIKIPKIDVYGKNKKSYKDEWKCPECGKENDIEDKVCEVCRHKRKND